MLHILSILGLLFWLVVIPFCIGLIPANFISAKKRGAGFILLAGYFVMWALFEVVAIPAVLFVKYDNFKTASVCFTVLAIVCAAVGVWLWRGNWKRHENRPDGGCKAWLQDMSWAERIEWLLFLALLAFQLYKAAAYASFDGDDAYYVVESLLAQQADVMYRILPYTGRPTDLDIRHALAVFPMWVAFIAKRSGIHATIVSHTIMPFVLIPLSYLVYYEIGKRLFRGENLSIFMILMGMFQIFGNVSIYTNETFFLTRTWQGKAVAGSLVIPALFWMFLSIYDGKKEWKDKRQSDTRGRAGSGRKMRMCHEDAGLWFVFVCINMTAGVCSSIAVFLVCILMALTALALAVTERNYKVILKMGAVCIPNVIYMAVYVIVAYSYLLK